ncbi:MAG: TonB-dependent receptor plug domain-containing protein [Gemmatimonadota bacterium]
MTERRSLRVAALAAASALSLAGSLAAQDAEPDSIDAIPVPPIVVSVSRVETAVSEAASSVTIVTREEIERRQLGTVLEALQTVPGVSLVRTGGPGSATSVFLRGASSDHALVLFDGIEMNDPSSPTGGYDFATLGTGGIERIEVLRGPQSSVHGSSALGGVVNVIMRRGEGPPRVQVVAEGGSYGSAAGSVALLGESAGWSWSANASRRTTDGFSAAPEEFGNDEEDGSRTTAFALKVERRAGPLRLSFLAHLDDSDTDIDQGGPEGDDPNRRLDDREIAWKAEARHGEPGETWRSAVSVTFASHDRRSLDDPDPAHPAASERGEFEGSAWKIAWVNDLDLGPAARVVAGAETEREEAATTFRSDGEFGPFESAFERRSARTTGAFAELRTEPTEPLSLSIGARADDHDRFGAAATARLAAALQLPSTGSRLRATWGTGFKAPTLFQLYDPEFGAPDLDPERSRGWDVGIDQELASGRVRLFATWFDTRFENLITFAFPEGYRNESETTTRGMETGVTALAASGVRLEVSYTFTNAEAQTGPDADLPLIRRPRHQGSLDAAWIPRRGTDVALGVRWVGEREDLDFSVFPSERVVLDSYVVARIAAGWEVSDAVRLFGRIENVLDADYEEVLDFGTAGRAAYVGVAFRP